MSNDNAQMDNAPSSDAPLTSNQTEWCQTGEFNTDATDIGNISNCLVSDNGVDSIQSDDDPILSLSFLQRYAASGNVSERQNAVRTIQKTLQNVEHDEAAVQVVFSLIKKTFAEDADAVVRSELLEQMPMLCMHCSQTPIASYYIRDVLFPLLVKFLNDPNTQVRKTCQAAILILIEQGLLAAGDIIELILPELIKLSGPCFPDDFRIEAVCLLCKFVSPLGRENTIKLLLNKFTELCQDSLFHVRKTCASHLGELSRVLGQELTEKLLVPHLISLSQDSVWGVRKTCAECFTDISYNCAMQTRRHQLAPVFIVLLADNSRWVQSSAFQALGPFIATFADSSRTGLKWVEGELVYDEPLPRNDSRQGSVRQLNSSGNGGLSTNMDGADENTIFSKFLATPDSSSSVITNIVQLAKQRLSGEFDEQSRSCIIDLSASMLPSAEIGDDMFSASAPVEDPKNAKDSLSSENSNEAEYNSFKFWHSNHYNVDDLALSFGAGVSLDSAPSEATVGSTDKGDHDTINASLNGNDVNYQKYMQRHLGVSGTNGSTAVEPPEEEERTESQLNDKVLLLGEAASKDVVEQQTEAFEDTSVFWNTTEPHVFPFGIKKDATDYISFAVNSESHLSPAISPRPFEYQDIIPQALLDQFLSMVEPSRAQAIESDIPRHCAYNLPAVAFTIGRKHWPLIKPAYLALANDMQWKVRRTLAFSIHDLAAILGPEITVQDLLPVFSGFLRDLDEVRIGILRHLYDFLKLLEKDVRKSILPSLADFLQSDNNRTWRFRHLFAEQLVLLCELVDIEDMNDYLSPIAMTLAIDKIAEIRLVVHRLLSTILHYFYKVEAARSEITDITDSFIQDIVKGFAKSQRWVRRQTFVYVCREVVRSSAIPESKFANSLLPALVCLCQDNIPNVRIVLASLFSELQKLNTGYLSDPDLMKQIDEILKMFANDPDRDVRINAIGYFPNLTLGDILTFNDQMDGMSFG